jgi:FKBP-type peptidyl-prolyl cis-trans isomerase FkpA
MMMKRLIALMTLLAIAGCGSSSPAGPSPTSSAPYTQQDLVVGTGAMANAGNTVTVAYTLWLYDSSKADGKGNQVQTNPSFAFTLGAGRVIAGWDRGVLGMKVGGQRRLIVPPDLAYGNNSPDPSTIPQNATLVFDITLQNVQ